MSAAASTSALPTLPAVAPPDTHAQRLEAALTALAHSRQSLRAELVAPTREEQDARAAQTGGRAPWTARWRQWRRAVRPWPVAGLATQALQRWWQAQPWHAAGQVLAEGVLQEARPLVQRHPVASALGAAVLGAAVVGSRPWRWPLLRQQFTPLAGGIGPWLLAQLGSAPVQAAISSALLMGLQGLQTWQTAGPASAANPAGPSGQDGNEPETAAGREGAPATDSPRDQAMNG